MNPTRFGLPKEFVKVKGGTPTPTSRPLFAPHCSVYVVGLTVENTGLKQLILGWMSESSKLVLGRERVNVKTIGLSFTVCPLTRPSDWIVTVGDPRVVHAGVEASVGVDEPRNTCEIRQLGSRDDKLIMEVATTPNRCQTNELETVGDHVTPFTDHSF